RACAARSRDGQAAEPAIVVVARGRVVSRKDERAAPTLAAVVPATNEPPGLDSCLAAIAAAADQPEELIVVRDPAEPGPASARCAGPPSCPSAGSTRTASLARRSRMSSSACG